MTEDIHPAHPKKPPHWRIVIVDGVEYGRCVVGRCKARRVFTGESRTGYNGRKV